MFLPLPPQYQWAEPVLVASIAVFIISWIGNIIIFSNRLLNALVTAIVFAAVFGAITYYGYGSVRMQVQTTPSVTAPATQK